MQQHGYNPKELNFGEEGRKKLESGITKLANAVKSTLGPRGNTVLIESPHHTSGITVTKDGVTVAKSIDLVDPVENLAVKIMKEAADRTATLAGDGTTTAIVLAEAIINIGNKYITDTHNRTEVLRELVLAKDYVVEMLAKDSLNITDKTLKDVAIVSANNDAEVGELITETYLEVGKDGLVTVEKAQGAETYYETTKGLQVDRGYMSNMFVNNHKNDECILEDVHILVSDSEISSIMQIDGVLKPLVADRHNIKLLIIAPCSKEMENTLTANVVKNGLKICSIPPPNFGYKQHELMSDIAVSVGATYFSEKTGDDLSLIEFSDLGKAKKVIVGRSKTVIINNDDEDLVYKRDLRVEELWVQHNNTKKKADRDFIKSRIATLTGGVGVIHVGGDTDIEQKELYDRVDDAVCAVRAALSEGILPGGGVALMRYADMYNRMDHKDKNIKAAIQIMSEALMAPVVQILTNAGKNFEDIYTEIPKKNHGYDVKNEKKGDLIKMGVIDPSKVTRSALINAMSVATTILSTNAIVTMARSYETN